jgi:hypothetical protein
MIYSYAELRNVIKVGDTVRAVKGKYNPCHHLNDDGSNTAKITRILRTVFFIEDCFHPFDAAHCFLEIVEETPTEKAEAERTEITWATLKAGDYVDRYGAVCKILARVDELIAISYSDTPNTLNNWLTIAAAQNAYTIVQPETKSPRKVTLAEVRERFGEDVVVIEE